jgi:hypothetical protein
MKAAAFAASTSNSSDVLGAQRATTSTNPDFTGVALIQRDMNPTRTVLLKRDVCLRRGRDVACCASSHVCDSFTALRLTRIHMDSLYGDAAAARCLSRRSRPGIWIGGDFFGVSENRLQRGRCAHTRPQAGSCLDTIAACAAHSPGSVNLLECLSVHDCSSFPHDGPDQTCAR